jgi:hypothetical protein
MAIVDDSIILEKSPELIDLEGAFAGQSPRRTRLLERSMRNLVLRVRNLQMPRRRLHPFCSIARIAVLPMPIYIGPPEVASTSVAAVEQVAFASSASGITTSLTGEFSGRMP